MKTTVSFAAAAHRCALAMQLAASAQEILLGYLPAAGGPFATFSKTNLVAAQMAVDEINAAGGINGKKMRIVSFDTAGKPDQAVVGVRKLAEDDKVMAVIGPFSSSECRVAFPPAERAGIVLMSMASSAPNLAEPFNYAFRNTSDEGYMFSQVMRALKEQKISDRDRRDRLCDRRRDLQDHGREGTAGVMKKAGDEDRSERDIPDAGVRLLRRRRRNLKATSDRSGRRRRRSRSRRPAGPGNAAGKE